MLKRLNDSLVMYLHLRGYRQKNICLITGYNQPAVSKIIRGVRPIVPSLDEITEDQIRRKYVVDTILECKELPTQTFCEQDCAYIKLLDFLLVDKEVINKMYYNHSPYKIAQAHRQTDVGMKDFDPSLIGISQEDYDFFLNCVQAKN